MATFRQEQSYPGQLLAVVMSVRVLLWLAVLLLAEATIVCHAAAAAAAAFSTMVPVQVQPQPKLQLATTTTTTTTRRTPTIRTTSSNSRRRRNWHAPAASFLPTDSFARRTKRVPFFSLFSSSSGLSMDSTTDFSIPTPQQQQQQQQNQQQQPTNEQQQQQQQWQCAVQVFETLTRRLQGDFDNYNQVVADRLAGFVPKAGGGHEHIHCTIIPVTAATGEEEETIHVLQQQEQPAAAAAAAAAQHSQQRQEGRLAAFYFEGNPNVIFRFRYYHLQLHYNHGNNEWVVDTIPYSLDAAVEGELRRHSEHPEQWPAIWNQHASSKTTKSSRIKSLPQCDVRWSFDMDPVQHQYAITMDNHDNKNETKGIHAVMVHGQALVDSQLVPGQQILIQDQLSLWDDTFWIHDRGFDPVTGNYIYGNQRGIPYCLERVTRLSNTVDDASSPVERIIVQEDLKWTLGPSFRDEVEYQAKMDVIGGITTIPSKKR